MLAANLDDIGACTRVTANLIVVGSQPAAELRVPLVVLRGKRPRPRVVLMAGIHGDEYNGILALQELAHELDPAVLLGTLIIVPVANPLAFAAAQRRTQSDNLDLNRVFPGNMSGTITQRLAFSLCEELLRDTDLVFTLHGAERTNVLLPWIEFLDLPLPLAKKTWIHARASGFTNLIGLPHIAGTLQTAMIDYGVPVIEGEVGGRGTWEPENVSYYRDRAVDVAASAGIVSGHVGAVEIPHPQTWHMQPVVSSAAGIVRFTANLGQRVQTGQLLGVVLDTSGSIAGEIVATHDGVIGARREHSGLQAGDTACILWTTPATDSPFLTWTV